MTRIYILFITTLFSITSFGQKQNYFKDSTSTSEIESIHSNTNHDFPSYIIFGIFCGECSAHCATMYHYNMMGNSNTLFVDSTDSYFKNKGRVVFKTSINDIIKFQAVNKLVPRIPKTFLMTDKREQTFGCPDCSDGCGIYFEIGQDKTIKKFYIDFNTNGLDKEVKEFGELIKETVRQLNIKNVQTTTLN